MSKDIYAEPDMNKKVKFNRGEMEERIVDIYISADTLRDGETSTKRGGLLRLKMDQETSTQVKHTLNHIRGEWSGGERMWGGIEEWWIEKDPIDTSVIPLFLLYGEFISHFNH